MNHSLTLVINGVTFSTRVLTYSLKTEVTYGKVLKAIDGTEYAAGKQSRDVLTVSVFPFNEASRPADYAALTAETLTVDYSDPNTGTVKSSIPMRLTTDLDAIFGLENSDGTRWYNGGKFTLRAVLPHA